MPLSHELAQMKIQENQDHCNRGHHDITHFRAIYLRNFVRKACAQTSFDSKAHNYPRRYIGQ